MARLPAPPEGLRLICARPDAGGELLCLYSDGFRSEIARLGNDGVLRTQVVAAQAFDRLCPIPGGAVLAIADDCRREGEDWTRNAVLFGADAQVRRAFSTGPGVIAAETDKRGGLWLGLAPGRSFLSIGWGPEGSPELFVGEDGGWDIREFAAMNIGDDLIAFYGPASEGFSLLRVRPDFREAEDYVAECLTIPLQRCGAFAAAGDGWLFGPQVGDGSDRGYALRPRQPYGFDVEPVTFRTEAGAPLGPGMLWGCGAQLHHLDGGAWRVADLAL